MFKGSIFKVALVFSFIVLCFFNLSQLFSQSKINSIQKKIPPNRNTLSLQKVTNNDLNSFIAINQCKMYIYNDGTGSYNRTTGTGGFYWPGGENALLTSVFMDGLVWAGVVGADTLAGGSTFLSGLQPGKILSNGKPDVPSSTKYRVFKANIDWDKKIPNSKRDFYKKDFEEWPVEDGAPWTDFNNDGIYNYKYDEPYFIGDEVLWYVANDLDQTKTKNFLGTNPIGIELQCTIWGYKLNNVIGDVVFKKYKLINKGDKLVKNMYLGIWADTDLGNAYDDYIGCDTTLNLGYCYNGDNRDEGYYDTPPPAVGYKLLQGPIIKTNFKDSAKIGNNWKKGFLNLQMTAFVLIVDPPYYLFNIDLPLGSQQGKTILYHYLRGKYWNGDPIIDPQTNLITKFFVPGDPVNKTGWYEGIGWHQPILADKRFFINSGPFNFAPNDTQEIAFAIIMARGNNNINSITKLKESAKSVQIFYDNFEYTPVKKIREIERPEFSLSQNYPNPFNAKTKIKYSIPLSSKVEIIIYDALGSVVSKLVNEEKEPGEYEIDFDSEKLSSGIYFCNISAREFFKTQKMIVLK